MKVLGSAVLGALLMVPPIATAATIPLDNFCTSFEFSPCRGHVEMTISAFEATRETTISVNATGPVRIIGFVFQPLDPSPVYDLEYRGSPGVTITDNPLIHDYLGTFTKTIQFPFDGPLASFSFVATNPTGRLVMQPFEFNGRGLMAAVQVVNVETGGTAYRAAPFDTHQADLVPMSTVPEPASMVLLGTGLAAAWRARRQGFRE